MVIFFTTKAICLRVKLYSNRISTFNSLGSGRDKAGKRFGRTGGREQGKMGRGA